MSETTNFNLNKPAQGATDWDLALNENFDIIDEQINEAQALTNAKMVAALEFTPTNSIEKSQASGYASLNASTKVPVSEIALNSSLITTALAFTPENVSNKDSANPSVTGYPGLDGSGKLDTAALNITSQMVADALGFIPENPASKGVGGESSQTQAAVPTLTSATSGSITVSGSGWVNSTWGAGAATAPWAFFNASAGNPHVVGSGGGNGASASITVDFGAGNAERIVSYLVGFNGAYCTSSKLEASNDGNNWTTLNNGSGSSATTINFINTNSYRYYKITLYSSGYNHLLPGDVQLYRYLNMGYVALDANGKVNNNQISLTSGVITDSLTYSPENASKKGDPNGYASLDGAGKIPLEELPLTEAKISSDLGYAFENPSNKDAANGYAGLGADSKIASNKISLPLDNLSGVSVSSPLAGQSLKWNGTAWVNGSVPSGVERLDGGLSDVVITSPATNDVLQHDGTKFVNASTSSSVRATVPVRQTVLSGSTDATGMANFLTTDTLTPTVSLTGSSVVPVLTTYTDSSGLITVSASTEYSSSYPAWKAFDGNAGSNFVFASGVTTGWLRVDLGLNNAKTINSYLISGHPNTTSFNPKNWTFEGSNTGLDGSWTVLDTRTNEINWTASERKYYAVINQNNSYRYYRLNITANNGGAELQVLQFELYTAAITASSQASLNTNGSWKASDGDTSTNWSSYASITPAMTGTTSPSGTVIFSSETSGREAWRVFDRVKVNATSAWSPNVNRTSGWVGYDFGSGVTRRVATYRIMGSNPATESPRSWTFQGSQDGNNWDTLDTQSNISFTADETKTFSIPAGNINSYRMYRVNVTATNGSNLYICELELAEATEWLQVELATANPVRSYAITGTSTTNSTPRSWTFEGSNNGTSWTTLHTVSNETTWTSLQRKTYVISGQNTSYKFYRLNISANNGNATTSIAEFVLYEGEGLGLGANINASASNPVILAFAAGSDSLGALDYVSSVASESNAFPTLPLSTTSYLYAERNTSTGAITYGATELPVYYEYTPVVNSTKTAEFVVEVFDNIANDGATITEIQVFNESGTQISFTTTSTDAYDSHSGGIPYPWNDGTWGRSNLNNGNTSYPDNTGGRTSTTIFLWKNAVISSNQGRWARFRITLANTNYSKLTFKLWAGSPENRIPNKITFYAVTGTYSLANHVQSRTNSGLVEIGSRTFTLADTTATATNPVDNRLFGELKDACTGGTVTASSNYSATWTAANAFANNGYDGASGTSWLTPDGTSSGWLQYQFPASVVINSYRIFADPQRITNAPKSWTFEASNTGAAGSWVTLDTQSNQTGWSTNNGRLYTFSNTTSYLYYRINISTVQGGATAGDNRVGIGEMEMYSTTSNLHCFDLNTMTMKVWNGSSWDNKQRVILGEATTSASAVTSLVTYALRGQYDSDAFAVAANTGYTKNHNLGVIPQKVISMRRRSSAYYWQNNQILYTSSYTGGHVALNSKTIHLGFNTNVGYGSASSSNQFNNLLAFPEGSSTSGEARLIVQRGW